MTWIGTLWEAAKDAKIVGLGFALAGLRCRLPGKEVMVPVRGYHLAARSRNSDFATLRQTLRDREYAVFVPYFATQLSRRCSAILAAGDQPVIIDAGANIGAASAWFAHAYPDATIVAIEPDARNAALLRRNLAMFGSNHVVLEAAVGAESGFVSTECTDGDGWAIQTVRATQGIPVVTISEAVATVANGRLLIAKIDIEGFEEELFAGNTDWLDDAEAVFVEPHDWMLPGKRTSRSFQAELGRRRFAMLLNGENLLYVRDRDPSANVPD